VNCQCPIPLSSDLHRNDIVRGVFYGHNKIFVMEVRQVFNKVIKTAVQVFSTCG